LIALLCIGVVIAFMLVTLLLRITDPFARVRPQPVDSSLVLFAWGLMLMLSAFVQQLVMFVRKTRQARIQEFAATVKVDGRSHVLLLRSFRQDRAAAANDSLADRFIPGASGFAAASRLATFEELLVNELYAHGPVVAISNPDPGVEPPDLGAFRVPAHPDRWLLEVAERVARAQLIVLLLDTTPGLKIELEIAMSQDNRHKVLLVVPALPTKPSRQRFVESYRTLSREYCFLPEFDSSLVAIDFHRPEAPEFLLADEQWPSGAVRALVVGAWLSERASASLPDGPAISADFAE